VDAELAIVHESYKTDMIGALSENGLCCSELDMDWFHPWIGLDWIVLDWIGSNFLLKKFGLVWIGSEVLSASLFFRRRKHLHLVFSFVKMHFWTESNVHYG